MTVALTVSFKLISYFNIYNTKGAWCMSHCGLVRPTPNYADNAQQQTSQFNVFDLLVQGLGRVLPRCRGRTFTDA